MESIIFVMLRVSGRLVGELVYNILSYAPQTRSRDIARFRPRNQKFRVLNRVVQEKNRILC